MTIIDFFGFSHNIHPNTNKNDLNNNKKKLNYGNKKNVFNFFFYKLKKGKIHSNTNLYKVIVNSLLNLKFTILNLIYLLHLFV